VILATRTNEGQDDPSPTAQRLEPTMTHQSTKFFPPFSLSLTVGGHGENEGAAGGFECNGENAAPHKYSKDPAKEFSGSLGFTLGIDGFAPHGSEEVA
jgi:hypothetical protein